MSGLDENADAFASLTRKKFLKGGGALVLGVAGAGAVARVPRAVGSTREDADLRAPLPPRPVVTPYLIGTGVGEVTDPAIGLVMLGMAIPDQKAGMPPTRR
jgi:hypothetical protein